MKMDLNFVLFLSILAFFILVLILVFKRQTTHSIEHMLVYTAQIPKDLKKVLLYSDEPELATVQNIESATYVHTDAFTYDKIDHSKIKLLINVSTDRSKGIFMFTNHPTRTVMDLKDIPKQSLRYQFYDETSKAIGMMLLDVIGLQIDDVFTTVSKDLKSFSTNAYPCLLIAFVSQQNKEFFAGLNNERVSGVDYVGKQGFSPHKLHVMLPYAYQKAEDLRILMPKQKDFTKIVHIVNVDYVVYARTRSDKQIDNIIQAYFEDRSAQSKEMRAALEYFKMIGFETLEGFQDMKDKKQEKYIDLVIKEKLDGKMTHSIRDAFKRYVLNNNRVEGVQLKRGDYITLTGQTVPSENDRYKVVDSKDKLLELVTTYKISTEVQHPISIDKETYDDLRGIIRYDVSVSKKHRDIAKIINILKVDDAVYLEDLDARGVVTNIDKMIYIIAHDDTNRLEWESQCITNSSIPTRKACLSVIDPYGNIKKQPDLWDRPCFYDSECPYFDVSLQRGGCRDGYCEMPVGVQRIAYKQHIGTPILHHDDGKVAFELDRLPTAYQSKLKI